MWSRRRLCVVLVTEDSPAHDDSRASLRDYAISDKTGRERVRYTYIFKDKQIDFVNALSSGMYLFLSNWQKRLNKVYKIENKGIIYF